MQHRVSCHMSKQEKMPNMLYETCMALVKGADCKDHSGHHGANNNKENQAKDRKEELRAQNCGQRLRISAKIAELRHDDWGRELQSNHTKWTVGV